MSPFPSYDFNLGFRAKKQVRQLMDFRWHNTDEEGAD